MRVLLQLIFLFMVSLSSIAQNDTIQRRPVNIGLTFGAVNAGINLELKVAEGNYRKKMFVQQFIRIMGGGGDLGMGGYYFAGGAWEAVFGPGNHHFEMGYGLCALFDDRANDLTPFPVTNWGYRFNKRTSRFYFRTGLGAPEIIYVGFGWGLGKIETEEKKEWDEYEW